MVKENSVSNVPDLVNWNDPALKRWLDTITKPGTRYNYRSAFRSYALFTGMTPSALIDEAIEDSKKDPRQKTDIVLKKLIQFFQWLKTECPRKSRGRGEHHVVGKGISDKAAHMYVASLRSFYATFGITVRMKGRHRLPRPRVENKRLKVNAEQVKVLVDHARTPRDRAVILTLFQSGMDVSTLCSLKYRDVSEGLDGNEHPLKLELYRPKTGTEYYTFLGRDAAESLKAYLADMKARGVKFLHKSALFRQERGKGRLKTNNVQDMMRELAVRSGFVDEENNGYSQNPLGPHALRESFGSIMTNSGVPDTVVDFWLGHEIGELAKAYKSVQFPSLKEMYLDREHLLSVSSSRLNERELEEKVSLKVDQRVSALRRLIADYATENKDLKLRIQRTESKLSEVEGMVSELKKLIHQNH